MFDIFKKKVKTYVDLDPIAFQNGMKDEHAVLVDVRTLGEFRNDKIPGSIHLDMMSSDFISELNQLPRGKAYYLYCRSGSRSSFACETMRESGFEKVYNLKGGIMSWPFGHNS
ncbi:MAG: rhodanese-like domain-containing protein [Cyclobacteriaceae bacterium]